MEDIIKQLYNGRLYPAEQYQPCSEAYQAKYKQYSSHLDGLLKQLESISPSLSEELDALISERNALASTEVEENYIEGFRLGAALIMDILHNPSTGSNKDA